MEVRRTDREYGMRRAGKLAAGLCLAAMLCAGCGQEQGPVVVQENTLVISDKGEVTAYVVGEFDKAYYDLAELADMARAEADTFSQAYEGVEKPPVSVESVEPVEDMAGKVVVAYRFDNADSYTAFMGQYEGRRLFYGTVSEAAAHGYLAGVTLSDVKDGTSLTEEGLKQNGDRRLIITDTQAVIYCPAKVTHLSKGASMNEDGSVGTFQAEDAVYILLK